MTKPAYGFNCFQQVKVSVKHLVGSLTLNIFGTYLGSPHKQFKDVLKKGPNYVII